jgi:Ca2+-binding EF-hand superfamily protein
MCRGFFPAVLFLTGFCCLALVQPVLAAPEEGSGKRAELRQKVLQKFDKNGNGQLDQAEKEAAKAQRREQGGGKGPGGKGGPDSERRQKLLAKFDTDGDGKLSETEKAAAKEARAKRGQ